MKIKKLSEATAQDGKGDYNLNLIFDEGYFFRWLMFIMSAVMIHEGSNIALLIPIIFSISQRYERTDRNKRGE